MFWNQFWPKFLEFYEFCEKFRKFFENFEKKVDFFGLDKAPFAKKKWPKNAIKMKISGVDKAPQKSSPPQNLSDLLHGKQETSTKKKNPKNQPNI